MKTENKSLRLLKWTVTHALIGWCAWEAVNGSVGAGRILVGYLWFNAVTTALLSSCKDAKKKLRDRGRTVPPCLCHGVDFALITLLVWHGWWFSGLSVLIVTIACAVIYDESKTTSKPTKP